MDTRERERQLARAHTRCGAGPLPALAAHDAAARSRAAASPAAASPPSCATRRRFAPCGAASPCGRALASSGERCSAVVPAEADTVADDTTAAVGGAVPFAAPAAVAGDTFAPPLAAATTRASFGATASER